MYSEVKNYEVSKYLTKKKKEKKNCTYIPHIDIKMNMAKC